MSRTVIILVLALAGCGGHRPPEGALGARWGEPVEDVAARLGGRCAMSPGGEYDSCRVGPVDAMGARPEVELIGKGGRLVGVKLSFGVCHHRETQKRVSDAFGVDHTPGEPASPYTTWSSGEVVHFRRCVLTVGNREYGKYFVGNLIGEGFGGLGGAMTPH